ncbi:excinuclease ABC subunit UvrA [Candidatus Nomurabacteria bacterium]|nr:excinuclease ABC subunit UvrA [Candidatus Nomurabacteria bacterium]
MVAITGLSGSGKSSLAFDTIFAEGQRRYVESLSAYARQFLSQMPKPDVDEITGLSPAISIDQKSGSRNPRSTIATMTEIYDYLRVLFARVGRAYSPISGARIKKMSNDEIIHFVEGKIEELEKHSTGKKKELMGITWNESVIQIYAPVVRGRKGEYYQMLYDALNNGFLYARVDGVVKNLRDQIILSKNKKHDIDFLVDEFSAVERASDPDDFRMRLAEAVERAIEESDGLVRVVVGGVPAGEKQPKDSTTEEFLMSAQWVCPEDGFSFPEIEPRIFSFNSPYGACEECKGLGTRHLFGNEQDDQCRVCQGSRLRREASFVLFGSPAQAQKYEKKLIESHHSIPEVYLDEKGNLKKKSGFERQGLSIYEFSQLSISDAHDFILELDLSAKDMEVAGVLLNEIESRLQFMLNVGLNYLTLNRRANTISGGEAQRIRLASQLGSKLVGALYVLDEPTIGLHERDNERLIKTLTQLRDAGNTIIVVEHDEEVIRASDYLVDIGPGAGVHGGHLVADGFLDTLMADTQARSLTLDYLRGDKAIEVPEVRRTRDKGLIKVQGGRLHNIEDLSAEVPLGRLVTITGVSGSGKSSFLYGILHTNLRAKYDRKYRSAKVYNAGKFEGGKEISRVILVDQSPIGRTPRSNPATYTGAWTFIRELFAEVEESRIRGWKAGRFSFNVKGGRCENCQGRGEIAVEMHFLPTVYVECDVCNGKRFEKETLQVKYKKKNVDEVLDMTVEEATEFFHDVPAIHDRMSTLMDVGLGYLKLGQPANTLSGGESQRVKIASELYRPMTQKTVYLLDEPTVGLHFEDVKKLIEILNRLVDRGNSVIVIEHNLDVVKSADYIIDFGPEGGEGGGKIIATGTPEEVAQETGSHTGRYLKKVLKKKK